ncbi:hypothetical protein K431DRAFT_72589 [Polychaeton citri CBS 116435]|uniref:Uncharacterized protein n=1 Tax=Polychaeton citri CBS 116435 TaxID=1314669 RepID=A0A9P4UP19_9PEZI|nr:hypothetical protein K431DRAFT_72589 [Polychaeton citri CBS 116435]
MKKPNTMAQSRKSKMTGHFTTVSSFKKALEKPHEISRWRCEYKCYARSRSENGNEILRWCRQGDTRLTFDLTMSTTHYQSESQQECDPCASHSHTAEEIIQIHLPLIETKMAQTPARLQTSLLLAVSADCKALFQAYLLKHLEEWRLEDILGQPHLDQADNAQVSPSANSTSHVQPCGEEQLRQQSNQKASGLGAETIIEGDRVRRSKFHELIDRPMEAINDSTQGSAKIDVLPSTDEDVVEPKRLVSSRESGRNVKEGAMKRRKKWHWKLTSSLPF